MVNVMQDQNSTSSTSLTAFAKVVADETRQQIMNLLCCNELCVSEIVDAMARQGHEVSQPTISHHLGALRQANLVAVRPAGRQTFYTLNQDQVAMCCGVLLQRFAPEQDILVLALPTAHNV